MSFENVSAVLTTVLYMVSAVLFIRGIKLLGKADTARKGNLMSGIGMLIAVVTVLLEKNVTDTLTEGPAKNAYVWALAAVSPAAFADVDLTEGKSFEGSAIPAHIYQADASDFAVCFYEDAPDGHELGCGAGYYHYPYREENNLWCNRGFYCLQGSLPKNSCAVQGM